MKSISTKGGIDAVKIMRDVFEETGREQDGLNIEANRTLYVVKMVAKLGKQVLLRMADLEHRLARIEDQRRTAR